MASLKGGVERCWQRNSFTKDRRWYTARQIKELQRFVVLHFATLFISLSFVLPDGAVLSKMHEKKGWHSDTMCSKVLLHCILPHWKTLEVFFPYKWKTASKGWVSRLPDHWQPHGVAWSRCSQTQDSVYHTMKISQQKTQSD